MLMKHPQCISVWLEVSHSLSSLSAIRGLCSTQNNKNSQYLQLYLWQLSKCYFINSSAMPTWMVDAPVKNFPCVCSCLFCMDGVTKIILSLCIYSQCLGMCLCTWCWVGLACRIFNLAAKQPLHSCVSVPENKTIDKHGFPEKVIFFCSFQNDLQLRLHFLLKNTQCDWSEGMLLFYVHVNKWSNHNLWFLYSP